MIAQPLNEVCIEAERPERSSQPRAMFEFGLRILLDYNE
jgi:hypothetical protein